MRAAVKVPSGCLVAAAAATAAPDLSSLLSASSRRETGTFGPTMSFFFQLVADILARATKNGRKVRAFGEMVTVMWAKGFYGAAVRLEYLWHRLCAENSFTLFCAYPKIGFAENGSEAIAHICAAHSKILAA